MMNIEPMRFECIIVYTTKIQQILQTLSVLNGKMRKSAYVTIEASFVHYLVHPKTYREG